MEIKNPNLNDDNDVIGSMGQLVTAHIEETNSKKSKIAKETVFLDISAHNQVGDVQAVTLEFANQRNYDTYRAVIQEFRDWAIANHNVEYVMEKTSITSYAALATELLDTTNGSTDIYYEGIKKYMVVDLPTSRGFK